MAALAVLSARRLADKPGWVAAGTAATAERAATERAATERAAADCVAAAGARVAWVTAAVGAGNDHTSKLALLAGGWVAAETAAAGGAAAAAGTAVASRVATGAATGSVLVGDFDRAPLPDRCRSSAPERLPALPISSGLRPALGGVAIALLEKILAIAGPSDRSVGFAFECRRARGEAPGRSTPASAGSVLVTEVPVACPCSGDCSLDRAPSSSWDASCLGGDLLAFESAIGDVRAAGSALISRKLPNFDSNKRAADRWGLSDVRRYSAASSRFMVVFITSHH